MNTSQRVTAAALLVALAGLTPAVASESTAAFREERVYFTCPGPTKVQAVNSATGEMAGWSTAAPSGGFADGEGCVTLDAPALSNGGDTDPYDAVWRGSFVGNLRELTVHGYVVSAGRGRIDNDFSVYTRVIVDGQELFPEGTAVRVTPTSAGGATQLVEFTVTGLNFTDDVDRDGQPDAGAGHKRRAVKVLLHTYSLPGNPLAVWAWGSSDAPAGVTFNPAQAAATTVPAGG